MTNRVFSILRGATAFAAAACLLSAPPAGRAEEVLWKAGINLYIKVVDQDSAAGGGTPPNQHPVVLDPREITNALNSLELWQKKGYFTDLFSRKDDLITMFSPAQATLLGTHIAAGLQKAGPRQDIVFAVARNEKGFLNIRDTTFTAGRAFYLNDRLHLIIGDYAKPPDRFQERAAQSHGAGEVQYHFTHGRRARPSGFKQSIISNDGAGVHEESGRPRLDWIVINVPVASRLYLARQAGEDSAAPAARSAAADAEAARLAQEQRELRLEMARMRKEMREMGSGDGRSIEERIARLNELYEKKLISKEEYEAKRAEILSEI
jgi:hypothetical protein